jgi:hypothetical protein
MVGVQVSLQMQYGWSSGIPVDTIWLEFRYPCGYDMVGVKVSLWIQYVGVQVSLWIQYGSQEFLLMKSKQPS